MTPEEAIEYLQALKAHPVLHGWITSKRAIQFGIEALKFIIVARSDPNFGGVPLLPDETRK